MGRPTETSEGAKPAAIQNGVSGASLVCHADAKNYFGWIGGAIFSAGACGSIGLAPSFCA